MTSWELRSNESLRVKKYGYSQEWEYFNRDYSLASFLVAETQLYGRLCPSVTPSVGARALVEKLETSMGGALGVDGGWLPLPTHQQQYFDPVSLVV